MVKTSIKVGEIYSSKNFGDVEVIFYKDFKNVKILFINSGKTSWVRGDHLKRGSIKDPYQPTVYGVGVVGDNVTKVKGVTTVLYNSWTGILERCYSSKLHKKHPTYKGCTVSEEWLYLDNYKVWFDKNHKPSWEVDKDLLLKGNKHYSKENCRFIPKSLNNLIKTNKTLKKSGLMAEVVYQEQCSNNPYLVYISVGGTSREYLGAYPCESLAFIVYKSNKESRIKTVAKNLYKDNLIGVELLQALMEWEVQPYE